MFSVVQEREQAYLEYYIKGTCEESWDNLFNNSILSWTCFSLCPNFASASQG